MKTSLVRLINYPLGLLGKRITNFHAPAKPYKQGIKFLSELLDSPRTIIDVGYADGTPDLTDAFPFNKHKYLLIDANPNFGKFLDRVQKEYPESVFIEKCFCGAKSEKVSFSINKTGHTSSRYYTFGQNDEVEVDVVPLDDLMARYNLEGPVLLKIDVEGAELDVLQGAIQTLKLCDAVVMETWINVPKSNPSGDFAALVKFMREQSFVVYDFFGGHNHRNGILAHVDTVFVKVDSKYRVA